MTEYFDMYIQESFSGEWRSYLNDIDPKYHVILTRAMSGFHNDYGDKAYKLTDNWFTILYGLILELEDVLECTRAHIKQPLGFNIEDITVKDQRKWKEAEQNG